MPRCLNCQKHVTVQFARVFGDNEDVVHHCMECVPNAELGDSVTEEPRGGDASWLEGWSGEL